MDSIRGINQVPEKPEAGKSLPLKTSSSEALPASPADTVKLRGKARIAASSPPAVIAPPQKHAQAAAASTLAKVPATPAAETRPRVPVTLLAEAPPASSGVSNAGPALNPKDIPAYPASLVTFVYDAGGRKEISNPQLIGSWDLKGWYNKQWITRPIPMQKDEQGRWVATVPLANDAPHDWQWGVIADTPAGKAQWAITQEDNPAFALTDKKQTVEFAPTDFHRMGAYRSGNDLGFRFWAPNARDVQVSLQDDGGSPRQLPMDRDPKTGMWSAAVAGGWEKLQGKSYCYRVTTSEGKVRDVADPYARESQGSQRGVDRLYLDASNGREVNFFDKAPKLELARFEVQGHQNADKVCLVLRDNAGNVQDKEQLLRRLGTVDSGLVRRFHDGQFSDLWSDNIDDKGRISLVRQGEAWATLVNDLPALTGLHYSFEVYQPGADGKPVLVGDTNRDGILQRAESKQTAFNDPYSDVITADLGSPRASIISDPGFQWKHDNAPRETDPKKLVIYELHVGSMFGQAKNVDRSTLQDLESRLDYFKSLGVNTLQLMPTNELEGLRDWGYLGTSRFAQAESYGFEDQNGRWVSGTEALKRFVDAAHARGLNVMNDVVYNHFGGAHNDLWNLDGSSNPYYNWKAAAAEGKPVSATQVRDTPWGAMPAFDRDAVRQMVINNAAMQVDELHFDGLRFDFTRPIQNQGKEGWDLLRQVNRTIKLFHPQAFTVAEEFPYDPALTEPVRPDGTGAGFDAEWNTEFQHRLVHDNDRPSILQQASKGQRTDMDRFMDEMINHPGFSDWEHSVTILSDHDEVGNAERTAAAASGDQATSDPGPWARSASRFAFGVGMLAPGIPMFFQGEESLATNSFKWGVPSTWDSGWDWEKPAAGQSPQNTARRQHFDFCKDAIALRKSSPAFDADAQVSRIYTHNDNSVMAFSREKGNDRYLVVGSLNHNRFPDYKIAVPEGKWQLVLDSDNAKYGGETRSREGQTLTGGADTRFDLPPGGMLVYKRIG